MQQRLGSAVDFQVSLPASNQLKLEVYRLAEQPRLKSDRRFYEQIRDAAASAPRSIAEGFSRPTASAVARLKRYLTGPQR